MVFQSYALYPHLSVFDNIAYPLRVRKVEKAEKERQVHDVAALLGLDELLDRRPRQLSGGQRQRVALARAIIRRPQAFLMDEPLSNLDAQLRLQMRAEIKRLQRELGATTLYVTHDQVEAMTMADTVAVMSNGPAAATRVTGRAVRTTGEPVRRRFLRLAADEHPRPGEVSSRRLRAPARHRCRSPTPSTAAAVKLGFRPEHALLVEPGTHGAFDGEIYVVEPLGNETIVAVDVGGTVVNVRATADFTAAIGAALRGAAGPAASAPLRRGDGRIPRRPPPAHDRPAEALNGRNNSKEERMSDDHPSRPQTRSSGR